MRTSIWIMVLALALGAAACSPKPAVAPRPPAVAAAPAPSAQAQPAPGGSDTTALAGTSAPAAPATAAMPATPVAEAPYRFSPGDYGRQERRIAALIANAETRDTLGETPRVAAEGRRARERCSTRRCVEGAYAAEEARLRKWEGSGDIR